MLVVLATPPPVRAAAGDLDPSFSGDGKLRTDFFGADDEATDVAIQADAKIVVVGDAGGDFALARYNSDGSLDAAFGAAGRTTTDFLGSTDHAHAVVLQPDGKIVVAGSSRELADLTFSMARYNTDGSLDASFGVGGKLVGNFIDDLLVASDVAVQADGRIVVAGSSLGKFAVARYEGDGRLDASFGAGGKVATDFFGNGAGAEALGIQPDGRIVVVGTAVSNTSADFAAARYNSDGSPDEGFGAGGKVSVPSFGHDEAQALALQPDGRILAAGTLFNGLGGFDFGLMRFKEDGSLDKNFGKSGRVTTDFSGGSEGVFDVALQADGRIVVVGTTVTSGSSPLVANFAIARYNSDGALDSSFGAGGRVATDLFGGGEFAAALAIQADGRLVVAGQVLTEPIGSGGNSDFAIARYSAASDFDIALEPQSAQVSPGQKIVVRVIVNRIDGFADRVTVTPPDTSNLGIKVNKDSVSTRGVVAKFKLKIRNSAPPGSHQLVFTAVDGAGRQRTSTLTLDIR
jgi:uncharacterized delta-60 repeat protein